MYLWACMFLAKLELLGLLAAGTGILVGLWSCGG